MFRYKLKSALIINMAELVCTEKENSDWFLSQCEFCNIDR